MTGLKLDILVIPTYNSLTLGIADASTYPESPAVQSPTLTIEIPGFNNIPPIPFKINDFNIINSASLGLSDVGDDLIPLPDGIYTIKYSVTPAYENYVNKTIIRVEQLQQKFDEAFMSLDMIECDQAIKKQDKVQLNTIYFLIQGSIAAANNCAIDTSNKLYKQAQSSLNNFLRNGCRCSGTNYITNFK